MLVTTSAPIIEETSNAEGDKKTGKFRKKAGEKFRSGYGKLKEAGALPVIENLLKLNTGSGTNLPNENILPPPPPPPTEPTGMSTTSKVFIGVLIVGAIAGAYYYFNKSGKTGKTAKKSK